MAYTTARIDDAESVIDPDWGDMRFLRSVLGTESVGVTLLELVPGGKGKPHDHAESDHEEVYLVLSGSVDVDLDAEGDERVSLGPNEAIRLTPDQYRQIVNRGDEPVRMVLVGGP